MVFYDDKKREYLMVLLLNISKRDIGWTMHIKI